jgi:hypothetical protein
MTARDELIRFTQMCKSLSGHVDRLRQEQFSLVSTLNVDLLRSLQLQVPDCGLQIVNMMQAMNILYDRYLLDPPELFQLQFLSVQMRVLSAHVDALKQELVWVTQGGYNISIFF